MAQSQNSTVELTVQATSFMGLSSYGKVMIGDKAFEFYNDRNVEDYIQIPWDSIDHVAASVMFGGRLIPRFAIMTKENGTYSFSTRDNKRTLRAMRNHLDPSLLVRSLSFFQVLGRGVRGLVNRVLRR